MVSQLGISPHLFFDSAIIAFIVPDTEGYAPVPPWGQIPLMDPDGVDFDNASHHTIIGISDSF
jgi:hypothetical protein